jgi:hypothetical protein
MDIDSKIHKIFAVRPDLREIYQRHIAFIPHILADIRSSGKPVAESQLIEIGERHVRDRKLAIIQVLELEDTQYERGE